MELSPRKARLAMRMDRRRVIAGVLAVLAGPPTRLAGTGALHGSAASVLPSDADIRAILADRVDMLAGKDDGVGIVVGVVGPRGRRVISYGHLDQGDPRRLDGDTAFEIASVGKVFTAQFPAPDPSTLTPPEAPSRKPPVSRSGAERLPSPRGSAIPRGRPHARAPFRRPEALRRGPPFSRRRPVTSARGGTTRTSVTGSWGRRSRHGPRWITRACYAPGLPVPCDWRARPSYRRRSSKRGWR